MRCLQCWCRKSKENRSLSTWTLISPRWHCCVSLKQKKNTRIKLGRETCRNMKAQNLSRPAKDHCGQHYSFHLQAKCSSLEQTNQKNHSKWREGGTMFIVGKGSGKRGRNPRKTQQWTLEHEDVKLNSISSLRYCVVVQCLSCVRLCDAMDCSTPGSPILHCLPEFAQIHAHRVGDAIYHLILCQPLLLYPSVFPTIGVFSNESALSIRWPKYWSFSFSISPSGEY